jgi:hypothetical protein
MIMADINAIESPSTMVVNSFEAFAASATSQRSDYDSIPSLCGSNALWHFQDAMNSGNACDVTAPPQ